MARIKGFETATITIKMLERGKENVLNTITKEKVTPPEYLILEKIHGESSIEFLAITKEKGVPVPAQEQIGFNNKGRPDYRERSMAEEYDRLTQWYGLAAMQSVYGENQNKLHSTFDDAGIRTERNDDNVSNLADAKNSTEEQEKLAAALAGTGGQGKK